MNAKTGAVIADHPDPPTQVVSEVQTRNRPAVPSRPTAEAQP